MGRGVFGIDLPRPGEALEGLGNRPEAGEETAHGEHHGHLPRRQALGVAGVLEGGDDLAPALRHLGETEPRQGMLRRQRPRLAEKLRRRLEISGSEGLAPGGQKLPDGITARRRRRRGIGEAQNHAAQKHAADDRDESEDLRTFIHRTLV